MRVSSKLGREVLDEAAKAIDIGVTTDEVDRVVHEACIERDCYPSPMNYYNFPASCCTSVNEVICHGIPDTRPLQVPLTTLRPINFHLIISRFWFCRTVTCAMLMWQFTIVDSMVIWMRHSSSEMCRRNTRIWLRSHTNRCKKQLKLWNPVNVTVRLAMSFRSTSKAMALAWSKVIAVMEFIVSSTQHRMYRIMPVSSFLSFPYQFQFNFHLLIRFYSQNSSENNAIGVMKAGHVFTIEPMISEGSWRDEQWPDNWTAVTKDGLWSAQFEQTLLVTETGCDILTKRRTNDGQPWFLDKF